MNVYHVLLVPEGEPPRLVSFPDRDSMVAWFKAESPASGYAYAFKGMRLLFTGGPHRYLADGDELVPLFADPSPGAPTPEASLEDLGRLDPGYAELTPSFGQAVVPAEN